MSSVIMTPEVESLLLEIKTIRDSQKEFKDNEAALVKKLLGIVGRNEEIIDPVTAKPIATWKKGKDVESFDSKAFKEKHEKLYAQFIKTRPGSRVLRILK